MAGITLYDYQKDALERMKIGCILCGGVGSGKSRTSLAFYYTLYGGTVNTKNYVKMHDPPDLCIITTARKRDTGEWEEELAHFYIWKYLCIRNDGVITGRFLVDRSEKHIPFSERYCYINAPEQLFIPRAHIEINKQIVNRLKERNQLYAVYYTWRKAK